MLIRTVLARENQLTFLVIYVLVPITPQILLLSSFLHSPETLAMAWPCQIEYHVILLADESLKVGNKMRLKSKGFSKCVNWTPITLKKMMKEILFSSLPISPNIPINR